MSKEIGKFQIPATKTILGIGGFGHVFEGFYEKDTKIAIKRIIFDITEQKMMLILCKSLVFYFFVKCYNLFSNNIFVFNLVILEWSCAKVHYKIGW